MLEKIQMYWENLTNLFKAKENYLLFYRIIFLNQFVVTFCLCGRFNIKSWDD